MTDSIPYGTCHCGCGEKTWIATKNDAGYGWIKGQPVRFVAGHSRRRPVLDRLWKKVLKTDSCWLWTGSRNTTGYGQIGDGGGGLIVVHRLAYESLVGPVPDGLELDHLCSVKHCVNPAHLEPVTHLENVRRYFRNVEKPVA